jgi:hypothetical protein
VTGMGFILARLRGGKGKDAKGSTGFAVVAAVDTRTAEFAAVVVDDDDDDNDGVWDDGLRRIVSRGDGC